jgi:Protein of unknown function (DUF3592)
MDVLVDFEIYSPQASPARRAWSYQTTRRSLRRRFLKDVALLAAGVLFVAMFVLTFDHARQSNRRLVTRGARTTGVITVLEPVGYRHGGWIRVSYTAGQRRLTAKIHLGSEVDRYAAGQKVEVYYDREHPAHMTIAGVDNQSSLSVALMCFAAILGAAVTLTALGRLLTGLRSRRVLGKSPWREVPATIVMDAKSRVVALVEEPPPPAVYRSTSIALRLRGMEPKQGVWTTGYLWIAGPVGRRAVLALPGGAHVLPVRSARTARGEARVRLLRSARTAARRCGWTP